MLGPHDGYDIAPHMTPHTSPTHCAQFALCDVPAVPGRPLKPGAPAAPAVPFDATNPIVALKRPGFVAGVPLATAPPGIPADGVVSQTVRLQATDPAPLALMAAGTPLPPRDASTSTERSVTARALWIQIAYCPAPGAGLPRVRTATRSIVTGCELDPMKSA
jgi:hypothetical protein